MFQIESTASTLLTGMDCDGLSVWRKIVIYVYVFSSLSALEVLFTSRHSNHIHFNHEDDDYNSPIPV